MICKPPAKQATGPYGIHDLWLWNAVSGLGTGHHGLTIRGNPLCRVPLGEIHCAVCAGHHGDQWWPVGMVTSLPLYIILYMPYLWLWNSWFASHRPSKPPGHMEFMIYDYGMPLVAWWYGLTWWPVWLNRPSKPPGHMEFMIYDYGMPLVAWWYGLTWWPVWLGEWLGGMAWHGDQCGLVVWIPLRIHWSSWLDIQWHGDQWTEQCC